MAPCIFTRVQLRKVIYMTIDLSELFLLNTRIHDTDEGEYTGACRQYTVEPEMIFFEIKGYSYPVVDKKPFIAEVSLKGRNKVHINGEVSISLEMPCDRCLEPTTQNIVFSFEKDIDFDEDTSEDMDDRSYIDGKTIDIDGMLYSEILMNLPTKVLCNEECKGICRVCGKNLNKGDCGCDSFVPDPRMSVISDIFKNFGK